MKIRPVCILLAAGLSSRMKGKNKLLLRLGSETLIRKSAKVIHEVSFQETVLVTAQDRVANEISDFSFSSVKVEDPSLGMHASIRKGLENLKTDYDAFLVYLADQPFLNPSILEKLIEAYPSGQKNKIVYPRVMGERTQPVLIGADFVPEILAHEDGDYGCAYLFKKYPDQCLAVDFDEADAFADIDTPESLHKAEPDPVEAFHELGFKLRKDRKPYVVATVIEVFGSTSARTGSKAIFSERGENLLGWVGGGCAEQHVAQQSLEALQENRTRIIEADLDDEIFGLGVACGGKMNIFLEPILPAEEVIVETQHPAEARALGKMYGWKVQSISKNQTPETPYSSLLMDLVRAISQKRKKHLTSLRSLKNLPITFVDKPHPSSSRRITLIGATRITESLERHFHFLGFQVRTVGPLLKPYGEEEGPEIEFEAGERVIVASHTAQDSKIIRKILQTPVAYAAMVSSRKRALEALTTLGIKEGSQISAPLFVPAGFDIDAKNPEEIALSIVAECMTMAPQMIEPGINP